MESFVGLTRCFVQIGMGHLQQR